MVQKISIFFVMTEFILRFLRKDLKKELIKVHGGLDLPIAGEPSQIISNTFQPRKVALIGSDYIGLKPTMLIKEGDSVRKGDLLFFDKKNELAKYVAPVSGTIAEINRGERRILQSVVINVENDEQPQIEKFTENSLSKLSSEKAKQILVDSGQWVAFRTRPYSKVPDLNSKPHSIFVTAIDTSPLAVDPNIILSSKQKEFMFGIEVLCKLCDGKINICTTVNSSIDIQESESIRHTQFSGKHPTGLAGTHIHFLDPVSALKTVWTINYQDVIAIGHLFLDGEIYSRRVISLAGPPVKKPRLIETFLGADLEELVDNELLAGENRVISGSVLSGRESAGNFNYLGRYHTQVSVIAEGTEREMLHYLRLGKEKHSALPIFLSSISKKLFKMTTSTNGSERAMVPVGGYEDVTVLDILPVPLLKALIVRDTEMAQNLGCLELDEEDMGLYTYVCVGKHEYGSMLRDNLTQIEKEG